MQNLKKVFRFFFLVFLCPRRTLAGVFPLYDCSVIIHLVPWNQELKRGMYLKAMFGVRAKLRRHTNRFGHAENRDKLGFTS